MAPSAGLRGREGVLHGHSYLSTPDTWCRPGYSDSLSLEIRKWVFVAGLVT